jgi:hypothetical protein
MEDLKHLLRERVQQCHLPPITQSDEILFSINKPSLLVNQRFLIEDICLHTFVVSGCRLVKRDHSLSFQDPCISRLLVVDLSTAKRNMLTIFVQLFLNLIKNDRTCPTPFWLSAIRSLV